MRPWIAGLGALSVGFGSGLSMASAQAPGGLDWPAYNGGAGAEHYSTARQITPRNVHRLEVAWEFDPADADTRLGNLGSVLQTNPLKIGRRLYLVSAGRSVFSLDALTGRELWRFTPPPRSFPTGNHKIAIRGLSYWSDGGDERVFVTIQGYLHCLRADSGAPCEGFGRNGEVDLREGLGRPVDKVFINASSPGAVYKDLLIVGSNGFGPGDIRAYDVRSGRIVWTFHTVPRPGEPGHETWPAGAWERINGANNWVGMTVDVERGLVFAPIASAKDAAGGFYGGARKGDNLHASSIIALDAATGTLRWSRQLVRHDIWDYDSGPQPTLVQVRWRGALRDAIAQPTKMGFLFLLDRDTGEPLQPMTTVEAPPSDVPGEVAAPTQSLPAWPEPFTRRLITEADLTRRTPEANATAVARFRQLRHGGLFEPPSLQGTLVFPGFGGGAAWGGAAYDPKTRYLYINSNEIAWIARLEEQKSPDGGPSYRLAQFSRFLDSDGYPAIAPPWGRLSAIDLNTGKYVWQIPFGEYPELKDLGPPTGSENYGGAVVTASGLLFIGSSIWDKQFRAYDSKTGRLLWSTTLPAAANATPAIYELDGRQFVVVAAGGGKGPRDTPGSKYVAFALSSRR